jgi:hypothetical protein
VSFRWDDSFDEAQKINQLMNDPRVRQDLASTRTLADKLADDDSGDDA